MAKLNEAIKAIRGSLAELEQERQELDRRIAVLEDALVKLGGGKRKRKAAKKSRPEKAQTRAKPKPSGWTAAMRKAASERTKRRWAAAKKAGRTTL